MERGCNIISNEYKDWLRDNIEENEHLCASYPFLIPRDRFTGEIPKDFDYSYTELDSMPFGWKLAFGQQMCEEIAQALKADDFLNEYRIIQIKEKFGELRWYDGGAPKEVHEIIEKYSLMSARLCINCGKQATRITKRWISPYCDECVPKRGDGMPVETESITRYFGEELE